MDFTADNSFGKAGTVLLEGDDPSSSALSSCPSFSADPASPTRNRDYNRRPHSGSPPSSPTTGRSAASVTQAPMGQLQPDASSPTGSPPGTPSHHAIAAGRSPVTIPPPSSMPPLFSSIPPPGVLVSYQRAGAAAHGASYGTKHTGPICPYTQPQAQLQPPQPAQEEQQQMPHPLQQYHPVGAQSVRRPHSPGAVPASPPLQRASSAPPARALSLGVDRGVALRSSDDRREQASSDPDPSTDPGDAGPGGSLVQPYGFLPPPATPPPLKPRWPTARLVSSRRSAAAAFASFSAAPVVALQITGVGQFAAMGSSASSSISSNRSSSDAAAGVYDARPLAAAPLPSARAQQGGRSAAAPPPKRRFSSRRTLCIADNLAFLNRGNTFNPPINERISRLLEVVLPRPTTTALALHAVSSPMAPPPPASSPPPEAKLHLGRALQQRREAVVAAAQRSVTEGAAAVAEAAATLDRWGSRREAGTFRRSLSVSAPWLGRSGEWGAAGIGGGSRNGRGDGANGFLVLGGTSVARRGASPIPGAATTVNSLEGAAAAGDGSLSGYYAPEKTAATVIATAAAVAAAAAVRHSGTEALHLQGISYKAAKAATRALADLHRPGISLRQQAHVESDYQQQQCQQQYQQQQKQNQQYQQQQQQQPHPPSQPPPLHLSPHPPLLHLHLHPTKRHPLQQRNHNDDTQPHLQPQPPAEGQPLKSPHDSRIPALWL